MQHQEGRAVLGSDITRPASRECITQNMWNVLQGNGSGNTSIK